MRVSYQDKRFSFAGFWQENQEGELVSYKRVAMVTIAIRAMEAYIAKHPL